MNCLAHRGFLSIAPENTLTAVETAIEHGADGLELDVRRCGSGELVVIHDEDVDRVTDASGPVSSFSADELADLSVLGSDDGVPTLESVCELVPSSVQLNIELKERETATETVEIARKHACDLLLSSFSAAALSEVRTVPSAYLFHDEPGLHLREANDLDCVAVHPHWHLCTESFITDAKEFGFDINVWTVNNHNLVVDLHNLGVDGMITDDPAFCLNE